MEKRFITYDKAVSYLKNNIVLCNNIVDIDDNLDIRFNQYDENHDLITIFQYLQDKEQILYIAQTPQGHNYLGYQRNTTRCYEWTQENGWTCLFSNTTNHRAKKFLSLYKKGLLANVNPIVIENYLTNGYNTRRGLLANYTEEQIERMKDIGRSHADYLGHEIGSTPDHDNRVYMRNEY